MFECGGNMKNIKNLRINKNIFNKGKMILITIPLLVTMLSSCSLMSNGERAKYNHAGNTSNQNVTQNIEKDTVSQKENNESKTVDTNQSSSTEVNINDINTPLKDVGSVDLTNIKLNYDSSQYANFTSYLNGVNVSYEYEKIYNFDIALSEYNKLVFSNTHNSKLKDLNASSLYNVVVENNKEFKKKNNSSIYKELDRNEANKITNLIVLTVNDFMNSNKDISADRIKCVLSDLKIFIQKSAMSNAFVTNDNCLVISPNMLKFATIINGDGTNEDVLKHEIIHLLQKGCNCDLNKNENLKRNFGISYGFDNIKINSLDFTWFYEAAAEKNMVNSTGHNPLVYKNMIGYLESFSMANLVKDSYKVNDTEKLSFKRNLNDLYNYFEVTSDADKREILNLMYSLEVMQQAPSDFYDALEKETGRKKDSTLIDEVNYTVKGPVCETLTKIFYRNLSKSIVNKDVSLGDVFYLISVFENDINNHIIYDSFNKFTYNEHFMNSYVEIQDNFFASLSKKLNMSQNELEECYNNYNSSIKKGDAIYKNYNLKFLGNDKINYLKEREAVFNKYAGPTIRNVLAEFENSKKVYN